MIAQRHTKVEAIVDAVPIHFANVVVHARGPQHRPRHSRIHSQVRPQNAHSLRARHQNLVRAQQPFNLLGKPRQPLHHFARRCQPTCCRVHPAAAKAHVVAHHPRTGELLEQVQNFFALAEGIHQRRPACSHLLNQKTDRRSVVLHPRQLAKNHPQIFGPLRNRLPGQLLYRQCVSPVVGQRAHVVQPIGEWHRAQVADPFGNLLVIAMQIAEDRLQPDHPLPVQGHIHAEDAVRRRVVRPHGHFQQLCIAVRLNHLRTVPVVRPGLVALEGHEFVSGSHWLAPVPSWPAPRAGAAASCAVRLAA